MDEPPFVGSCHEPDLNRDVSENYASELRSELPSIGARRRAGV
jgi:hypothetical protein